MFSSTLLPLFMAASALAAPLASSGPISSSSHGQCSTAPDHVDIPPNQTTISQSALPVSYVAVGYGTQNYTCSSAGTYTNVGAVAKIVDISCLYSKKPAAFATIQDDVLKAWTASSAPLSTAILSAVPAIEEPFALGDHYFITNPVTGTGLSPVWDFTGPLRNPAAIVVAAKVAGLAAPTGHQDIDWVFLKKQAGSKGSLADEVYRTDTRLGQPPATCTFGSSPDIQVKYAAKYWLNGGTVKQ